MKRRQREGRSVDIGVHGTEEMTYIEVQGYTIYEPFMLIEAKRLPAPSSDREREYVSGSYAASGGPSGGIHTLQAWGPWRQGHESCDCRLRPGTLSRPLVRQNQ